MDLFNEMGRREGREGNGAYALCDYLIFKMTRIIAGTSSYLCLSLS